jgi:hypothetical protein
MWSNVVGVTYMLHKLLHKQAIQHLLMFGCPSSRLQSTGVSNAMHSSVMHDHDSTHLGGAVLCLGLVVHGLAGSGAAAYVASAIRLLLSLILGAQVYPSNSRSAFSSDMAYTCRALPITA